MDSRIQELERRLARLEEGFAELKAREPEMLNEGTKLAAPVQIVDDKGTVLVEIRSTRGYPSLRLFTAEGRIATTLGVGTEGGYLTINNVEGIKVGYLNVEQSGARLILNDHGNQGGVVLFGGDAGNEEGGAIKVLPKGNGEGLRLWATPEGGGLEIYDAETYEPVIRIVNTATGGHIEVTDLDGNRRFTTFEEDDTPEVRPAADADIE